MPMLIACPNPKCNFPGPMGFSDPVPWGLHVYHGRECNGAWLYNNQWYAEEKDAWNQYKKDNMHLDRNWVKAFDARILKKSERSFNFWIKKWNDEQMRCR